MRKGRGATGQPLSPAGGWEGVLAAAAVMVDGHCVSLGKWVEGREICLGPGGGSRGCLFFFFQGEIFQETLLILDNYVVLWASAGGGGGEYKGPEVLLQGSNSSSSPSLPS